jgi:hypothetical protein
VPPLSLLSSLPPSSSSFFFSSPYPLVQWRAASTQETRTHLPGALGNMPKKELPINFAMQFSGKLKNLKFFVIIFSKFNKVSLCFEFTL